jgi:hypothetical protein
MQARIVTLTLLSLLLAPHVDAQGPNAQPVSNRAGASGWRPPSASVSTASGGAHIGAPEPVTTAAYEAGASAPASSPATDNRITRAQVTQGSATLPRQHGQVWREYDISPYTLRIQTTNRPEQAIVDWILRETGYEAWHSTPVGLLSADSRTLRVYHTPEMQSTVANIVDRFVNRLAETQGFGMRIITIRNPNWRTRALPLMKPIPIQSPGVQGWLLAREDAALLLSELVRRTDYREHNPPHQLVGNGQSMVVSSMRPRTYTKGIIQTQATWPGYQPEIGKVDEGFSLEFSPLLALDTRSVDAVIKLRLAQVEKMLPVKLEVPTSIAPNQQTEIQIPQMTMIQLHERFRWPTDQVLLLSLGVVATPGPQSTNMLTDMLPLPKSAPRADALLLIESKGESIAATQSGSRPSVSASRPKRTFHGRY